MTSPCIKPSLKPQIIELLKTSPMTANQLSNRLSCARNTCGAVMRKYPDEFYVKSWTLNQQQIWAYGKGENAPRPKSHKKKESMEQVAARRARSVAIEHQRLREGYIKGVRLPWELTPCHQ